MADKSKSVDKDIAKAQESFDRFENELKDLTLDSMNQAPKKESELELSQNQLAGKKEVYLKPSRTISSREPFNEKYREDYEFKKQFVCFIAENKEIIGETIQLWTKKFPGIAAEYWEVPVNTPVWGPRYLAEQIKGCTYHRFSMQDSKVIGSDGMGTYHGSMIVDNTVQRLDANPYTRKRSIFMGAEGF
jgi:hypothetical protein